MSIEGRTTGIFIYGYNLNSDGSLGRGTKQRVLLALRIHMDTPGSVIVAAAGISPCHQRLDSFFSAGLISVVAALYITPFARHQHHR